MFIASLMAACDRDTVDEQISVSEGEQSEDEQVYEIPFPRNDWACTEESGERIVQWMRESGATNHVPLSIEHALSEVESPAVEGPGVEKRPIFSISIDPEEVLFHIPRMGPPLALEASDERVEELLEHAVSDVLEG